MVQSTVNLGAISNEIDGWASHYGIANFQGPTGQNQNLNAFAHAYASGVISYDYGVAVSNVLGSGREYRSFVTDTVKAAQGVTGYSFSGVMRDGHRDMYNNHIGNQIAQYAIDHGLPKEAIGYLVADALRTGQLVANEFKDPRIGIFSFLNPIYKGPTKVTIGQIQKDFGIDLSAECFLAGTMIDMWPLDLKPDVNRVYDEKAILTKVWQKPIEEVTPDDWVVSYDDNGRLKPGRVTRTFQNHSKHILDVHGLMMTPGHVTYCAKVKGEKNRFADSHVPIMDILRSDGALKKNDGTLIRAATGCEIGSKDDEQFWAFLLYEDKDGSERIREKCQLRLGTRWMLPNGHHFSMREYMNGIGIELIEEGPDKGYVRFKKTGLITVFAWTLSETLPKPEDYVLQRSAVTLEEIYSANEWEAVRPQSPAPFMGEVGHSFKQDNTLYAGSASDHLPPNIPHSMRNSPNQPTMSRQQRRAIERKQKKAEKRSGATVH